MVEFFATSLMLPGRRVRKHAGPNESFTTIELKINFFRPVWRAQLKAEGAVLQLGRTVGYVECSITDEQNRLIAKAASTCMVLRAEQALGR